MQEGLFGVVICAMMLLWLLVSAFFQPRGVQRALVLFLVVYIMVASYTEDAFTDASTYLLSLTAAASLLIAPLMGRDDSHAVPASLQGPWN
jgi:membrane associated rhomboid family serine protease